jgi:hypothetical protein
VIRDLERVDDEEEEETGDWNESEGDKTREAEVQGEEIRDEVEEASEEEADADVDLIGDTNKELSDSREGNR